MSDNAMPQLFPSDCLGALDASFASQLIKLGVPRTVRDGEPLYVIGSSAEGLYQLISGQLRLCTARTAREFTFAYANPGDWIGEIPLLNGLPHATEAIAVGDCNVLLVPKSRYETLLDAHPHLYKYLAKRVAVAMRIALNFYADLACLPLPARLAKRLLELAASHGQSTDEGVVIRLRLPQELVAGMVATSRQTVSKELKQWEAHGWIAMRYNTLILKEPESLHRLLTMAESGE